MSNNENNKHDGFGKGITLIIIGLFALMVTFFDFEINWHIMFKLWPMILIIIGVCIMPINRWIRMAVAVVLLALGYVAYQNRLSNYDEEVDKTEIITYVSDSDEF